MHSRQQQHAATEPTNTSSHHSSPRLRRALGPEQKTCLLFIQTDHLFTQHYGSRDNVIAQIAGHVKALDAIYQNTNFNGIRGINFMVKRVRVNGTDEARDPTNPFRFPNI
ncbi:disintegrin and metalloproteinase domain-containing protein 10-like, partial [Lampetra planeri]